MTDRGPVEVSVVVPAYRSNETLPACVSALLAQTYPGSFEVVVCVSADSREDLPALPADPCLRVLTHVPRLPAAAARNRAVGVARGKSIAFTDADVIVPPRWLEELTEASEGEVCAAGSVINGTPESLVGTAEYLMEFLDLHPRRRAAAARYGATCNLLVPRRLWDRYGPFPEDMFGGEDTVFTVAMRKDGLFTFAPRACVTHLNRTSFRRFITHQYDFGSFTSRLARRPPDYIGGGLVRATVFAPFAAIAKLAWVYLRVTTVDSRSLPGAVRCLPVIAAGVLSWATGLFVEGLRHDLRKV